MNTTEAMVDCAENLLEKGGYVRPREVIAIVAGTRTKSGSTNFLRLHALGRGTPQDTKAAEKKRRAATRNTPRLQQVPYSNP